MQCSTTDRDPSIGRGEKGAERRAGGVCVGGAGIGSSQGKEISRGRDTWSASGPQMYTQTPFSMASPWSLCLVCLSAGDARPGSWQGCRQSWRLWGKVSPSSHHFHVSPWGHFPAGSLAEPFGPVSHRLDSNCPLRDWCLLAGWACAPCFFHALFQHVEHRSG